MALCSIVKIHPVTLRPKESTIERTLKIMFMFVLEERAGARLASKEAEGGGGGGETETSIKVILMQKHIG